MTSASVARDDRLEHAIPAVGAVHVAGAKRAALQIAELVEHKERMIAGAAEVAVPDALFLFAMRRADARIHVEHDASWRTAAVNAVDPSTGEIGKCGEVFFGWPASASRSGPSGSAMQPALRRPAADDPAHRRIMPKPFGVVHVFIPGEAAEHGLTKHADQARAGRSCPCGRRPAPRPPFASVPERHRVRDTRADRVGRDHRAPELQLQAAVEIEPQSLVIRFHPSGSSSSPRSDESNLMKIMP